MKFMLLLLIGCLTALPARAAPTAERASLALLLTQLNQLEATLQRAQEQAENAPVERFIFDYPQVHADINAMRNGIAHYLTPTRAQPRTVLPLLGQYRKEGDAK